MWFSKKTLSVTQLHYQVVLRLHIEKIIIIILSFSVLKKWQLLRICSQLWEYDDILSSLSKTFFWTDIDNYEIIFSTVSVTDSAFEI